MGLECEWRLAQKRWSRKFEDLKKESVWSWLWARQETILSLPLWHRELSSLPWSRELESWLWTMLTESWVVCHWSRQLRSWVQTMILRSWVKTMVLRSWSLTMEFCISLPKEILNTTGCAARLWGQIVLSAQ